MKVGTVVTTCLSQVDRRLGDLSQVGESKHSHQELPGPPHSLLKAKPWTVPPPCAARPLLWV